MAMLAIDSFDHYATADLPAKGWSQNVTGASTVTISAGTGRNGTQALRLVTGSNVNCSVSRSLGGLSITGSTVVVGCGFRAVSALQTTALLSIWDGGSIQLILDVTSTGALVLKRPNSAATNQTTTGATAMITTAAVLVTGTYAFIEVKAVIANAGGTAEVKVNGVSMGTFSGDTSGNNTAVWSSVVFGNQGLISSTVFTREYDDLYLCDGSGASHNDFLGDHRVIAIVASAGNGSNTAWTPSTGTDHGALVDEATPNTSDYVSTGTVNAIDTFNFAAVGIAGTVKAVQVLHYCKCDVAGLRTMAPAYRIGGAAYVGAGALVPADWAYQSAIATVSPATALAWTVAEIDAAEFGVKVTV